MVSTVCLPLKTAIPKCEDSVLERFFYPLFYLSGTDKNIKVITMEKNSRAQISKVTFFKKHFPIRLEALS
jgi:hypothetical protein